MRFIKNMLYGSIGFFIFSLVFTMMIGSEDTIGPIIIRSLIFAVIFAGYYEYTQFKQAKNNENGKPQ